MAENLDWLYDYLLQFLKSPGWRVPILNFIDQYCYQFEDNNENKLVYTEIHNKFKDLIDGLLENICITLNITQQQFANVCEAGIKNAAHKRVFEQMLACDNFISFKKLMIKRNKELEAEAAKHIEVHKVSDVKKNEEAEIDLARAMSLKDLEEQKRIEDKYNEDLMKALKLSEVEFAQYSQREKELDKARQNKIESGEVDQARIQALRQEEELVRERKRLEEEKIKKLQEEEIRINKEIEEKRMKEEKRLQDLRDEEARIKKSIEEKKMGLQLGSMEAERNKVEEEARRLQEEQNALKKKIQEDELNRIAAEGKLLEDKKKKEEKRSEKERKIKEEEMKKLRLSQTEEALALEKQKIEEEKLRIQQQAKELEEERLRLIAEKEESKKRKAERQKAREEKARKQKMQLLEAEEKERADRQKELEAEERRKIQEAEEKVQRLKKENKKLEDLANLKRKKDQDEENARQKLLELKKEQERAELGPESSLNVKNLEDKLDFVEVVSESRISHSESNSSNLTKSSLPPIHGRMQFPTMTSMSVESQPASIEERKAETPAEREARLKKQRDQLLAKKRAERESALKEYISEGGTDLTVKASAAVSKEELEKRKQVLFRIKTYSEDQDNS